MTRKSSGIPGLDKLIEGGFPDGSIVLYSGAPGTGKTIAAMQFIAEGLKKGEKCAYVSIEEAKEMIIRQATLLGLNIGPAVLSAKDVKYPVIELKPEGMGDVVMELINQLSGKKESGGLDRVVIDSLNSFTLDDGIEGRALVKALFEGLQRIGVTAVVTSELAKESRYYSRDTISEFLADGLVVFNRASVGEEERRTLTVAKMRETKTKGGMFNINISAKGIIV